MGIPTTYQFDLPEHGRPDLFTLEQEWYPGVRDFWTNTTSNRNVDAICGVETIVIHATAGSSSTSAMSVMKAKRASWHWLVPDEDELQHGHFVWVCVPEWMAAWHVLDTKSHLDVGGDRDCINQRSLGIEIVNAQAPADTFSDWQIQLPPGLSAIAGPNIRTSSMWCHTQNWIRCVGQTRDPILIRSNSNRLCDTVILISWKYRIRWQLQPHRSANCMIHLIPMA